jgi:hypothetical protein
MMTYSRSSARASGALIMLLGAWGGIAPYVGPLFGYRMDDLGAWSWTTARAELSLGPGVIAVLGGLLLLVGLRPVQRFGAFIAAAAGTWFVVGPSVYPLWGSTVSVPASDIGRLGSAAARAVEEIGFFYGTGVLIALLAAFALGTLTVLGLRWAAGERAMELTGGRAAGYPAAAAAEPAGPPPPPVAVR